MSGIVSVLARSKASRVREKLGPVRRIQSPKKGKSHPWHINPWPNSWMSQRTQLRPTFGDDRGTAVHLCMNMHSWSACFGQLIALNWARVTAVSSSPLLCWSCGRTSITGYVTEPRSSFPGQRWKTFNRWHLVFDADRRYSIAFWLQHCLGLRLVLFLMGCRSGLLSSGPSVVTKEPCAKVGIEEEDVRESVWSGIVLA